MNGRLIKAGELNKQIETIVENAGVPGMSFAVIAGDKVVFYHTYGYKRYVRAKDGMLKGKKRINKKTVFEACSLSKTFLTFAVLRLVEKGLLSLDTPLYRYLPNPRLAHDERYKKITGRMVLSHCSGLENWKSYNNPDSLEIMSEPGAQFTYSGEGYVYLSQVCEKLLGKSTESYLKELVYDPLKLRRTFTVFDSDTSRPRNYSQGHDDFLQTIPKEKNTTPNVAALITTTANDYAHLLIGLYHSGYLSQARLGEIASTKTTVDDLSYWGEGIAIYAKNGDTIAYQPGENDYFKGLGMYQPAKGIGFVMFMNGRRGKLIEDTIMKMTLHCFTEPKDADQYPNIVFDVLAAYRRKGRDEAENRFRQNLRLYDSSSLKSNLDELTNLFLEKEPAFAVVIAQEYMTRYPYITEASILHGKAMMQSRRFREAIGDFERAIAMDKSLQERLQSSITQCREQLKKGHGQFKIISVN